MRLVLQRVRSSWVEVEGVVIGQIGVGLNILVGIGATDTEAELEWMARKCLELRLFPDRSGRLARSVQDIHGDLLVISQFTLYGDCRKGRRPDFGRAASTERAQQLYDQFVAMLQGSGLRVESGRFGAMMQVYIEDDGPVTVVLEREQQSENCGMI